MLLALDPGTNTGVAIGPIGGSPRLATIALPAGDRAEVGPLLASFERQFLALIAAERPTRIVIEAPWLGPKLAANMHSARRVIGLPCVIELIAARAIIPVHEAMVFDIRGALLGDRKAPKHRVMPEILKRGLSPANEHEADAAAVWLYANTIFKKQETRRDATPR